jgi:ubiquinone/menaquinone biosynthesis C-methylase UbiE
MGKVNLGRRTKEAIGKIPAYQKEFYSWIYESPRWTKFFDSQIFWNILTFGYSSKMAKSCTVEVDSAGNVLQFGATFGKQIDDLATKIGVYGQLDLMDVSLTQLRYARNKYCYKYPFIRFINQDVSLPINKKYDAVICYMLLHQVPMATYTKIINNALNCLKPGGKAIFIDYNNSVFWHPVRYVMKIFNRLYQPFAEKMWNGEIRTYAKNPSDYYWRKITFFGKLYQKVTVIKKDDEIIK